MRVMYPCFFVIKTWGPGKTSPRPWQPWQPFFPRTQVPIFALGTAARCLRRCSRFSEWASEKRQEWLLRGQVWVMLINIGDRRSFEKIQHVNFHYDLFFPLEIRMAFVESILISNPKKVMLQETIMGDHSPCWRGNQGSQGATIWLLNHLIVKLFPTSQLVRW